jgi:ribose-phosphate pyrophosphokinase
MKILNLSDGFSPISLKHGWAQEIEYEKFIFSGGEPHIKLKPDWTTEDVIAVTTRINSMNDLGLLLVAVDALYRVGNFAKINLILPYFPGARQDREMVPGEPLTAKVYADIINDLSFDGVTILDAHSDVTPALLDNCNSVTNHKFVAQVIRELNFTDGYWLVSPDAGANKKILKLAQHLEAEKVIKCDKVRNIKTGALSSFEVYADDLMDMPCVIVDDICDGGGTFIGLAEELKKKHAGDLYLVVTHGIFSKGLDTLNKVFKGIYTTDSIKSWDPMSQMKDTLKVDTTIKVIELNSIMLT